MKLFEILATDKGARAGVLHLPHGDVATPAFMCVGTRGAVKALTACDIRELGFQLILANTYHLHLRPGEAIVKSCGGLHGFEGLDCNFLTDSGGFQVFSLAKFRKLSDEGVTFQSHIDGSRHLFTPESVVQSQVSFNSDIQMALDVCSPYGASAKEVERALELTTAWQRRAFSEYCAQKALGYEGQFFPIIQGGFSKVLRAKAVKDTCALGTEGVAIGGLSVGESAEEFFDFVQYTSSLISEERAKYVMGIGTPQYLLQMISAGCDLADCVLPTRLARHGVYLTHHGPLSIKQERYKCDMAPPDNECECKVCRQYKRAYLRHLFMEKEITALTLASYHNLYFLKSMMDGARKAIFAGSFEAYKKDFLGRFCQGGRE